MGNSKTRCVADGNHALRFRLYLDAAGDPKLWEESKSVPVKDGLFSTVLGDTTALDHSFFDGQELWLGVTVGTDAEATPRQQVLPVAYALSLVPGAEVIADSGSPLLEVTNVGSGDAISTTGAVRVDGDLNVTGDLNGGTHSHAMLPIAYGNIDSNCTVLASSGNVTCAWNSTDKWYELAIAGESYHYADYVTVAMPVCTEVLPAVSSIGGKLTVEFHDKGGAFERPQVVTHPRTGLRIRTRRAWTYEPSSQTAAVVTVTEELDDAGQVLNRWQRGPVGQHCVFRFEMEHLLARAGFEVEGLYGDFFRGALADGSSEMIWLARVP